MSSVQDLVDDWQAMKAKLEQQLEAIEYLHMPGAPPNETIRRWIVELDDLIIKYSFPI